MNWRLRQGESELGAALVPLALAVPGVILTVVGILGIFVGLPILGAGVLALAAAAHSQQDRR
ncbi:hypothetical protein [Microbispora triticiradicis]|uniref:hypothetical protein n=1 Tax=Microbispora triticiradicis TaxID=2200763 RepID=UPI001AD7CE77|nr:hypothetical protein [Microbispora triticiradicis]MBO4269491.1 hypothetical protein [Microbispora triticiradicis]